MEGEPRAERADPVDEGGEPACSMHMFDDYLEPADEPADEPATEGSTQSRP